MPADWGGEWSVGSCSFRHCVSFSMIKTKDEVELMNDECHFYPYIAYIYINSNFLADEYLIGQIINISDLTIQVLASCKNPALLYHNQMRG